MYQDLVYTNLKIVFKIEDNNIIDQIIIEAFNKNRKVFGRKRLSEYIRINYGIFINYRTLGRKMQKLGLFCKIRQKRKAREKKNIITEFENIVARDNNEEGNLNIWVSDVTYIQAPKDVFGNHVYFSVIIIIK